MQQLILILTTALLFSNSLNSQTWTRFDVPEFDFKELQYYDFTIDKNNNFWLATLSGLYKFDGEKVVIYNTTNSDIPSNELRSLAVDLDNNLWVGTQDGNGIVKFDGINWIKYDTTLFDFRDSYKTFDITFDKFNNPWFGTWYFLRTLQNGYWKIIKHQKEFDNIESNVNEVRIEKENSVWFLTRFQGLFKFDKFQNLTQYSHINPHNYRGLAVDSNNNIWVSNGTFNNQLLFLNTKTNEWKVYDNTNVKIDGYDKEILFYVYRIIDPNNNMWFSSLSGLIRYDIDNDKWEHFDNPDLLTIEKASFIKVVLGADNCIWGLSSRGAVYRLCDVVSEVEETQPNDLVLFPNPTNGTLTVEPHRDLLFTHYKIIDIKSKTIIESKIDHLNNFTIDTQILDAGVYYLLLTSSTGEQLEEKFIAE